tara:strand:- start:194 stop:823 length:630 start_codon:yes stop_codon:yes gene_type:complete
VSCCVCESPLVGLFLEVEEKTYWQCKDCMVIFLDPKFRLSPSEEKYRYQQHNNDIYDEKYRLFLSKLYKPLKERLKQGSRGLDFGCGPGPALAEMFKEDGFHVDLYDPFFFKDESVFSETFDFITCTETIEHFFEPAEEFKKLDKILTKEGYLAIMTTFLEEEKDFGQWHYRKDPTHVVFYQFQTFKVIASNMNWTLEIPEKDVVVFKK